MRCNAWMSHLVGCTGRIRKSLRGRWCGTSRRTSRRRCRRETEEEVKGFGSKRQKTSKRARGYKVKQSKDGCKEEKINRRQVKRRWQRGSVSIQTDNLTYYPKTNMAVWQVLQTGRDCVHPSSSHTHTRNTRTKNIRQQRPKRVEYRLYARYIKCTSANIKTFKREKYAIYSTSKPMLLKV